MILFTIVSVTTTIATFLKTSKEVTVREGYDTGISKIYTCETCSNVLASKFLYTSRIYMRVYLLSYFQEISLTRE